VVTSTLGTIVNATKLSWLIPIPVFMIQAASTHIALTPELLIDTEKLEARKNEIAKNRIIFQITTRGENLDTLRHSFDSTRYWIGKVKKERSLDFRSEIWILTEQDRYEAETEFFDGLEENGAVLVVVPSGYETPNGAGFKARALHYACEVRMNRGIDTTNDWVYHQDTETMIGEDTVLGNLDFVTEPGDDRLIGAGIILYPLGWKYKYNSVEETTRSVGDIGALGQMRLWGAVPFGYHGSHLIVRADVENDLGWDYGKVRSEDLLFSLMLRERFGGVTRELKGFAYEKPPFTLGDQLKQRRRWILGSVEVLKRRDVALKHKLPLLYSLSSWMSALPSIFASILGLFFPTGGFLPYVGGFLTGFMWWTIYSAYKVGLELHEPYIEGVEPAKGLKLVWGVALGMLFDAVAPWYAIIRGTNGYEEIRKDDPTDVPLDVVVDVEAYAQSGGRQPSV
jgi:beta-1,4-mannosyltransferase